MQDSMQDSIYYTDFRWPELNIFAERNAIILLPVGQTEEHAPICQLVVTQ